jgi:Ricin-type beta-trefoil lectin domain-like
VKSIRVYVQSASLVSVLLSFILVCVTLVPPASLTQTAPLNDNNNAPPFDFNDAFYKANGIDLTQLNNSPAAQRFGFSPTGMPIRQTGTPAGPGQLNWVIDNSNTDPIRNNVRILATTGGYKDDTGSPTQFISIIAFLTDQNFFTPANQHGGAGNARGLAMQDIAGQFEAYAGLKQIGPGGVFLPAPCASIGIPNGVPGKDCFSVASVETPNLRQDWRFSTNRNAIDSSAQLSYFGDNLLGMWIITYHWYTAAGFGPKQTPDCKSALSFIASRNGLTLDGTPLIKTGAELHFLENNSSPNEANEFPPPPSTACAQEGNLDFGGADRGPVWLICPSIPDPTHGGIAPDAFVDTVHKQDGSPLDPQITNEFNCLQKNGQFCPLANGTYRVLNQESGLFWDDPTLSSGPVPLEPLNPGSTGTSQQWTFTVNSDGIYRITNKANGLALSDPPANGAPGKRLVLAPFDGDANQKWIVTPLNNGYSITNVFTKLAVDATTAVPSLGTSIVHATPTGDSSQVWVVR